MKIFGQGPGLKSSNFLEGSASEHRATSRKKTGIKPVLPGLDDIKKEVLFVDDFAFKPEVSLKSIRVIEIVGGLNKSDFLIFKKADGLF